jgi:hypothetical protein
LAIVAQVWMASGRCAAGAAADFDFSISYSGQSITGRLVGLQLDANGNASEIDPTSVELFHVPDSVGLSASPSDPYVFVPHTYERSTYFSGTFSSTTPNVYGFQVSSYTITPASQNLLMSESGGDVTLLFNFGAGLCGECGVATYGVQGEEDALWAAVNSFVSFAIVGQPGDYNGDGVVDAADYTVWRDSLGQTGSGLAADGNANGAIDSGDYTTWKMHFGEHAVSGAVGAASVLEPATLSLLFIGVVTLCGCRRFPLRGLHMGRGDRAPSLLINSTSTKLASGNVTTLPSIVFASVPRTNFQNCRKSQ